MIGLSKQELQRLQPKIYGYCHSNLSHPHPKFSRLLDGMCADCCEAEKSFFAVASQRHDNSSKESWYLSAGTALSALQDAIDSLPEGEVRRQQLLRRALALVRVSRLF